MREACLTISKRGKARFISHLDLYRAIERALRRALLPIAFTQGYNPHPKISFLTALELGATSDCEKAIIYLEAPFSPTELKERLNRFLPQDIRIEEVSPLNKGKIVADSSLFLLRVGIPPSKSKEDLERAIDEFHKTPSILVKRETKEKTKDINVKDFLKELRIREFAPGEAVLEALILITPYGSVKPREVIQALETFMPGLKLLSVHRKELFLKEMEE